MPDHRPFSPLNVKDQPLVSLLMPSYNSEEFIGEAIESVIASTYQNWELIVVDDLSKDRTLEIARSYEAKDSRIKVYLNEKNEGDYPNRNVAASYAKGKYIKYIDHDDAIYYWGLEVEVEMMERFPEAGYGLDSIAQDDEQIFPYMLSPEETYRQHYLEKRGLFDKAPTSCIINREVFIKEGEFAPIKSSGDYDMWHRLSMKYPLVVMPHGIIWSRYHAGSESAKTFISYSRLYQYQAIARRSLENPQCPLPEMVKGKLINKVRLIQVKLITKCLLHLRFDELKAIKKWEPLSLGRMLWLQLIGR
ncbi:N/A [soil metagenome]